MRLDLEKVKAEVEAARAKGSFGVMFMAEQALELLGRLGAAEARVAELVPLAEQLTAQHVEQERELAEVKEREAQGVAVFDGLLAEARAERDTQTAMVEEFGRKMDAAIEEAAGLRTQLGHAERERDALAGRVEKLEEAVRGALPWLDRGSAWGARLLAALSPPPPSAEATCDCAAKNIACIHWARRHGLLPTPALSAAAQPETETDEAGEVCERCEGTGRYDYRERADLGKTRAEDCHECDGTGRRSP